jgi:hypothetical protein
VLPPLSFAASAGPAFEAVVEGAGDVGLGRRGAEGQQADGDQMLAIQMLDHGNSGWAAHRCDLHRGHEHQPKALRRRCIRVGLKA